MRYLDKEIRDLTNYNWDKVITVDDTNFELKIKQMGLFCDAGLFLSNPVNDIQMIIYQLGFWVYVGQCLCHPEHGQEKI